MENTTSIEQIRKGISRISRSKITLLDSSGNPINNRLYDAVTFPNLNEVDSLANELGYDPNLFAAILSDASNVPKIIMNSPLYLETLIEEGTRIAKRLESRKNEQDQNTNPPYTTLSEEERNRLATFLYRPGSERQLTYFEEVLLLFHDTIMRLPFNTRNFDELAIPMEQGLRKILRYQIERHYEEFMSNNELDDLWRKSGWTDYIDVPSVKVEETHQDHKEKNQGKYDFHIPNYNLPISIKNILRDVRTYLGESNDLAMIISSAQEVLPHREEMQKVDYFDKKTIEADRLIVIDRALTGYPII